MSETTNTKSIGGREIVLYDDIPTVHDIPAQLIADRIYSRGVLDLMFTSYTGPQVRLALWKMVQSWGNGPDKNLIISAIQSHYNFKGVLVKFDLKNSIYGEIAGGWMWWYNDYSPIDPPDEGELTIYNRSGVSTPDIIFQALDEAEESI